MKFLLENQINPYLRIDKSIEQFIERVETSDYSIIRWVAIVRTKDNYELIIHEVFDERGEVETI